MPEVQLRFSAEDGPRKWATTGEWRWRTLVFILPSYLEQQWGKYFVPWKRSMLAVSTCDTEEGHGGAIGDLRGVLLLHHQARNPLRHHGASSSPLRESHHCRTTLVVALYAVHLFTAVYWHTSGSARTLLSTDVGFRGLAPMPSGGNQLRTKVRPSLRRPRPSSTPSASLLCPKHIHKADKMGNNCGAQS